MDANVYKDTQLVSARIAYHLCAEQVAAGDEEAAKKLPGLRAAVDQLEGVARDQQAVAAARDKQAEARAREEANAQREAAIDAILADIEVSRQLAGDMDDWLNAIRTHWDIYTRLIAKIKKDTAVLIDRHRYDTSIYGRRRTPERLNELWRGIEAAPVLAALQRGASQDHAPRVRNAAVDLAARLQYILPISDPAPQHVAPVEEPQPAVEQPQQSAVERTGEPVEVNMIEADMMSRPVPMQAVMAEGDDDDER